MDNRGISFGIASAAIGMLGAALFCLLIAVGTHFRKAEQTGKPDATAIASDAAAPATQSKSPRLEDVIVGEKPAPGRGAAPALARVPDGPLVDLDAASAPSRPPRLISAAPRLEGSTSREYAYEFKPDGTVLPFKNTQAYRELEVEDFDLSEAVDPARAEESDLAEAEDAPGRDEGEDIYAMAPAAVTAAYGKSKVTIPVDQVKSKTPSPEPQTQAAAPAPIDAPAAPVFSVVPAMPTAPVVPVVPLPVAGAEQAASSALLEQIPDWPEELSAAPKPAGRTRVESVQAGRIRENGMAPRAPSRGSRIPKRVVDTRDIPFWPETPPPKVVRNEPKTLPGATFTPAVKSEPKPAVRTEDKGDTQSQPKSGDKVQAKAKTEAKAPRKPAEKVEGKASESAPSGRPAPRTRKDTKAAVEEIKAEVKDNAQAKASDMAKMAAVDIVKSAFIDGGDPVVTTTRAAAREPVVVKVASQPSPGIEEMSSMAAPALSAGDLGAAKSIENDMSRFENLPKSTLRLSLPMEDPALARASDAAVLAKLTPPGFAPDASGPGKDTPAAALSNGNDDPFGETYGAPLFPGTFAGSMMSLPEYVDPVIAKAASTPVSAGTGNLRPPAEAQSAGAVELAVPISAPAGSFALRPPEARPHGTESPIPQSAPQTAPSAAAGKSDQYGALFDAVPGLPDMESLYPGEGN